MFLKGGSGALEVYLKKAAKEDAKQICGMRSASFYEDYAAFGECPGYGIPAEQMELAIQKSDVYLIFAEGRVVGDISVITTDSEDCRWIGCVEIIPEFQNKGIASRAMEQLFQLYPGVMRWRLDTPVQRKRNCHFYEKLGFHGVKDRVHSDRLTLRIYEKD